MVKDNTYNVDTLVRFQPRPHYICGIKKRKQSGTIEDTFTKFVDGYQPKPFISSEWPLEDGIYKQYSAFEESGVSVSGTANTLKLI